MRNAMSWIMRGLGKLGALRLLLYLFLIWISPMILLPIAIWQLMKDIGSSIKAKLNPPKK